jgi:hypothetical protein
LVTREYAVGKSAANRVFPDIAGYSRVLEFSRFSDWRQASAFALPLRRDKGLPVPLWGTDRFGPPGTG